MLQKLPSPAPRSQRAGGGGGGGINMGARESENDLVSFHSVRLRDGHI